MPSRAGARAAARRLVRAGSPHPGLPVQPCVAVSRPLGGGTAPAHAPCLATASPELPRAQSSSDRPPLRSEFGKQEPGSAEDIRKFAEGFGAKFDIFAKVDVNGSSAHPLFKLLRSQLSDVLGSSIKWNFTCAARICRARMGRAPPSSVHRGVHRGRTDVLLLLAPCAAASSCATAMASPSSASRRRAIRSAFKRTSRRCCARAPRPARRERPRRIGPRAHVSAGCA
eukprot:70593-Prymnesium_polylepis.2